MRIKRLAPIIVLAAAILGIALSIFMLERHRAGVSAEGLTLGTTPVTIWRADGGDPGPLVVVAHGYAGSRQMMQSVSITLARSGFTVAAFDFHGHGRNPEPLRGDITSIEGTTALLVEQAVDVADAAQKITGATGPVSLVGHSMATDVVIRAAKRIEGTGAVVAISMYSDAVTPTEPARLLIVSGAQEGRLRDVALTRLRQVDPAAVEGETVRRGSIERRAVAAPWVGHVGVLYSPFTLAELRSWVTAAVGLNATGALPVIGPWLLVLLVSLVVVMWPVALTLGPRVPRPTRIGRWGLMVLVAPVVPAIIVASVVSPDLGGRMAFGALVAFFAVWGGVQLVLLWRVAERPAGIRPLAFGMLLIWGLCLFAPLLDRYGAAFIPTGPRLWIMGVLLIGTVPYCVADALLVFRSGWGVSLAQRVLPLAALLGAMVLSTGLGVAFTVIPVMVLFWLVYGVVARWVRSRSDPWSAGLALGVILAWSIAASTPMVAS